MKYANCYRAPPYFGYPQHRYSQEFDAGITHFDMPPVGIIDVMSKIHHTDGTCLDVADFSRSAQLCRRRMTLGQFDLGSRVGRRIPAKTGIWSNREAGFCVVDLVAWGELALKREGCCSSPSLP